MSGQINLPVQDDAEFSRLAWELAQRATFSLDMTTNPDTNRVVVATINTHTGPVKGYGSTHTEAMRHLAEGLDLWADEWKHEPIPTTESVATGPTIATEVDLMSRGQCE